MPPARPALSPTADVLAAPVSPAPAETPAFSSLFTPLKADFRRMATDRSLTVLGLGIAGAFSMHALDPKLSSGGWGSDADRLFSPGRVAGSAAVQGGAAFATYLVGRAIHQPRVASLGAKLVRAQIVAQTTTQFMKIAVRRTRPDGSVLSFPSGHTSAAFATATVLQSELGWKAGVPAYAMATWIGASRMEGRRHYLSDVIAGATVGILAGHSVTFGAAGSRFSLSPLVVPGGGGLNIVRIGR
ncbi:MAG: phosphatase PAP2 family protein [Vicinamibacterales bacterium]